VRAARSRRAGNVALVIRCSCSNGSGSDWRAANVFRTLRGADERSDDAQAVVQSSRSPPTSPPLGSPLVAAMKRNVDDGVGGLAADAPHHTILDPRAAVSLASASTSRAARRGKAYRRCGLEQAGLVAHGAGETRPCSGRTSPTRAAPRGGGAVHGDERLAAAPAVRVNELRNLLFACTTGPV